MILMTLAKFVRISISSGRLVEAFRSSKKLYILLSSNKEVVSIWLVTILQSEQIFLISFSISKDLVESLEVLGSSFKL